MERESFVTETCSTSRCGPVPVARVRPWRAQTPPCLLACFSKLHTYEWRFSQLANNFSGTDTRDTDGSATQEAAMRGCTWEKEVDRGSHRGGDSGLSARHPDCPLSFLCNGTQSFVSPALLARELNKCANVDHSVHLSLPIATGRRQ